MLDYVSAEHYTRAWLLDMGMPVPQQDKCMMEDEKLENSVANFKICVLQ